MDHDARWFTADCAKENSFVCKFERSHNPITDNGPPEGCPEGFEAFEDKCYKFVSDVYATQGDAQKVRFLQININSNNVLLKKNFESHHFFWKSHVLNKKYLFYT